MQPTNLTNEEITDEIFVLEKRCKYIEQALETFADLNPIDTLDEVSLRIALKNGVSRIKHLKG